MFSIAFSPALLVAAALVPCAAAQKVLLSNDDGWAVANIRAFDNELVAAGFNVVLSAPAENESGTGSSDATPKTVGSSGCEFDTCPAGAPATGTNASNTRLNYVNSFPVTSVKIGVATTAPPFFGGTKPDIVVTGPNVGTNLGGSSGPTGSGTVGAATEGALLGIPAIAFSGASGSQVSFTTLSTASSSTTAATVYASLATTLTRAVLASTAPLLPAGTALNVNFAPSTGACTSASAFEFILTRVTTAAANAPPDVETCGAARLPTEASVIAGGGCRASVSIMNATTKGDVSAAEQGVVLAKLSTMLSCI